MRSETGEAGLSNVETIQADFGDMLIGLSGGRCTIEVHRDLRRRARARDRRKMDRERLPGCAA